jgi:hypothetical protein
MKLDPEVISSYYIMVLVRMTLKIEKRDEINKNKPNLCKGKL